MDAEEKTAFVVGVDHRIQYTNTACGPEWTSDIREFEDYLVREATKHEVDVLAEEFSEEVVQMNHATGCTVRDAAGRACIDHLFLDPDTSERAASDITRGDQREMEWLSRLRRTGATRPLVVCGDDHVDSFTDRLEAAGFRTSVLSRDWGNNWMLRN
jgi:hypothetical protein